ncbi:MAG: hypothetical protein RDV48_17555 [Candidatus Eremiobacteraeota bacterium]|nr:hypothetical protein [Candidatus Eremiobacteraeota bacterium]
MTIREVMNCAAVSYKTALFPVFFLGIQGGMGIYQLTRIPLLLVCFGIASREKRDVPVLFCTFAAGMLSAFVVLGTVLGHFPGLLVKMALWTRGIYLILGSLSLVLGVLFSGLFFIDGGDLRRILSGRRILMAAGAFVLGVLFSLIETPICPGCGSNLSLLADITVGKGNHGWGSIFFLAYASGEALPLLLTTLIAAIGYDTLIENDTREREFFMMGAGFLLFFCSVLFFWTA